MSESKTKSSQPKSKAKSKSKLKADNTKRMKAIVAEAKKLYTASNKSKKWTDCIKEASKNLHGQK